MDDMISPFHYKEGWKFIAFENKSLRWHPRKEIWWLQVHMCTKNLVKLVHLIHQAAFLPILAWNTHLFYVYNKFCLPVMMGLEYQRVEMASQCIMKKYGKRNSWNLASLVKMQCLVKNCFFMQFQRKKTAATTQALAFYYLRSKSQAWQLYLVMTSVKTGVISYKTWF